MTKTNKVFGIGLSRTGTTSLNKALEILGYSSRHYPEDMNVFEKIDAGTDITVAIKYRHLDKKYPGSKFILTERRWFEWIKSMKKHYDKHPAETRGKFVLKIRTATWGTIRFNPIKLTYRYLKHNMEVKRYFKHRKDNLLVLRITDGEGWEKLCPFLRKKIPNTPFPKLNVS
jgi:hypothetical protein